MKPAPLHKPTLDRLRFMVRDRMHLRIVLLVCFVLAFALLFHLVTRTTVQLVSISDADIKITDFAYHILVIRAFWLEGMDNMYRLESQLAVLSHVAGKQVFRAMPIGVTPVAAVLWYPFALIAGASLQLANTLWVTTSVALLIYSMWLTDQTITASHGKSASLPEFILKVSCLTSASMSAALLLGQTSIIATGSLLLLSRECFNARRAGRRCNYLTVTILLCILAVKPTYFVLGICLLLIFGHLAQAAIGIAIVGAILALLTIRMGLSWPHDYLATLMIYSNGKVPPVYDGIVLETMDVFRSAFEGVLGSAAAIRSSQTAAAIGIAGICTLALLKLKLAKREKRSLLDADRLQLFGALISLFLLFSPYLGSYEDVLTIAVFGVAALAGVRIERLTVLSSIFLILLVLMLNHNRFPPGTPIWPFWLMKATVLVTVLGAVNQTQRRNRPELSCSDSSFKAMK